MSLKHLKLGNFGTIEDEVKGNKKFWRKTGIEKREKGGRGISPIRQAVAFGRRAFRTNGRAIGETPLKYRIGLWARIIIFTIYLPVHVHARFCRTWFLDTSVRVKYRWNEVPDNVSLRKQAAMLDIKPYLSSPQCESPYDERILRFFQILEYTFTQKAMNEYQRRSFSKPDPLKFIYTSNVLYSFLNSPNYNLDIMILYYDSTLWFYIMILHYNSILWFYIMILYYIRRYTKSNIMLFIIHLCLEKMDKGEKSKRQC